MMPKMSDIQVVVMMGGLGRRLGSLISDCPKPMLPVSGKPFFDYELLLLKLAGFRRFLFCTGHMSREIESYYKDGSHLDISITYSKEPELQDGSGVKLLGTGGALRHAYDKLSDDFLLVYADSFMDIDYREVVWRYFKAKEEGFSSLMTLLKNNGDYDKSNVIYKDGALKLYDKKQELSDMDHIDYGVNMFSRQVFAGRDEGEVFDLGDIQHELSLSGRLYGLVVTRRFYEIGRVEPYKEFISYVKDRFEDKKKAVFLDRDGVLNEIVYNEDTEQLDSPLRPSELKLLPGAARAVAELKSAGYHVFVVTNQPAAAKGKTDLGTLFDINKKLMELIPDIDEVFMCPHHPVGSQKGREREGELICECECRKPKDGLIRQATAKYAIDSDSSYMVGDSHTDIICGRSAKLKTVFIGSLKCDTCKKLGDISPDYVALDIEDAASYIISGRMRT